MVHVLFDFEIDESIASPYSKACLERIRSFYLERYNRLKQMIELLESLGYFPVMVLRFIEQGIESIPLDIPDIVICIFHSAVTQEEFNEFKQELKILCPERG